MNLKSATWKRVPLPRLFGARESVPGAAIVAASAGALPAGETKVGQLPVPGPSVDEPVAVASFRERCVWCFAGALRALPMSWRRGLAHGLAPLLLRLSSRTRRRMVDNLAQGMPALDAVARERLARRASQSICQGVLDSFWLDHLSLHIAYGDDEARRILGAGQGASIVTMHMGCFEAVALAVQQLTGRSTTLSHIPTYLSRGEALYRRVGITCLRKSCPGVFFELLAAARQGHYITLHADQDGRDLPVRFFSRDTWAPAGAVLISALARRPLLLGYAVPGEPGHYSVHFETVCPTPPARHRMALCAVLQDVYHRFEAVIAAHAAYWDWSRRRWRAADRPSSDAGSPQP